MFTRLHLLCLPHWTQFRALSRILHDCPFVGHLSHFWASKLTTCRNSKEKQHSRYEHTCCWLSSFLPLTVLHDKQWQNFSSIRLLPRRDYPILITVSIIALVNAESKQKYVCFFSNMILFQMADIFVRSATKHGLDTDHAGSSHPLATTTRRKKEHAYKQVPRKEIFVGGKSESTNVFLKLYFRVAGPELVRIRISDPYQSKEQTK